MNKERLLELAGVPVTEAVSPDTKFVATTISMTFKQIEDMFKEYLSDYIADGDYPEGSTIKLTDEIAQQFIDKFGEALYDTAGNSMADAEIDLVDQGIKKSVKKGK